MKHLRLRPLLVMISAYLGLALLLLFTDPRKMPIVILLVPFVLLYMALYLTVRLVLEVFLPNLGRRKRVFVAALAAGLPSFLLLLSSVNQLTWRDVALVAFLVICLLFYNSRASFSAK